MKSPTNEFARPRLGVSMCLLGRQVRYDGGHKHDEFLTSMLGPWVEWVEVCPEVELGLGVPRPTLRLVGSPKAPRMEVTSTGEDLTERMNRWSKARVAKLEGLDGYVLKKNSPSCGLERVKVYGPKNAPLPGRGLFAAALIERWPLLPVEEEGRLHDPMLRENFVTRIFAHRRFRELVASKPKPGDLVAFHTREKLALSAHHAPTYRELGRLVAGVGRTVTRDTLDEYGRLFMGALAHLATRKKNADVLFHVIGHLKRKLDAEDRAELVENIEAYRMGQVPLAVPLTLIRHHFRRNPSEWVLEQSWLNPYPAELMLRNVV